MRLEITGFIDKIGGLEPQKRGFRQIVVVTQPESTDDMGRVVHKEQHFQINIWSEAQTDSRFLNSTNIKQKKNAVVYLKGERWINEQKQEFSYANKLNLKEWGQVK